MKSPNWAAQKKQRGRQFDMPDVESAYCWIALSRLQSSLVDWIVIDNPKSKSDFGFGLSIQFCHFNPNPKYQNHFIKKLKFHSASFSNDEAKTLFIKIFKQLIYQKGCKLMRDVSWEFHGFIIKLGH